DLRRRRAPDGSWQPTRPRELRAPRRHGDRQWGVPLEDRLVPSAIRRV
ncbi:MAG: hypothetical protein AVDCRST_MAG70-774, partial [uncultured Thermomicrobiales bacterium]